MLRVQTPFPLVFIGIEYNLNQDNDKSNFKAIYGYLDILIEGVIAKSNWSHMMLKIIFPDGKPKI